MSRSRCLLAVVCGLALLLGLFLAVSVSAWYYPDAGIPESRELPPAVPPAADPGEVSLLSPGPGAVFTTLEGCSKADAQNVNEYFVGDPVSLRATGFPAGEEFYWSITGVSEDCDKNEVVASGGPVYADEDGYACIDHAYYIQADDCGVYKFEMGGKSDNYHIGEAATYRLDLAKTGTDSVCFSDVAQTVYYTYTVTNSSSGGTGVTLYDVEITDNKAGTIATDDTNLDAGESATFYKSYSLAGGTAVGTFVNTASATSNTQSDGSGETINSNNATWTLNIINCCALQVTIATQYNQCSGTVTFTATASSGEAPYTFAWDLDNDGEFDDAVGATTSHPFADGTHTIHVLATDGTGCQATDDIEIVVAVPAPQVDITKTVDESIVHENTAVTYHYYITNTGTCPLLNVSLSDDKIPGVSAAILSGLSDQDGDSATDDLAVGASANGSVSHTILVNTHNCATATGQNSRGSTASAQDCADVAVILPCIDLEKTGPGRVYEGEWITYEFVLSNCSSDIDLHDVTVTDTLLGGLIWGPGDLGYGQSVTFTVDYMVPWEATNPLTNTALAEGYDPLEWKVSDPALTVATLLRPLGFKFWDENWDGVQEPTEPLMGMWQIELLNLDTGVVYTAWTNNSLFSGHYGQWFPPKDMPPGRYEVYEILKPGWTQTYPNTYGGRYRILYGEDGTFAVLSMLPKNYSGLNFGNAVVTACPCFDWVVFQSNRDGNWELYGVSAFGGTPVRLTNDLAVDTAPAVSRATEKEDKLIAFQSNRNGNWDIYRVDADGQNLLQLTTGAAANPAFNNTDPVWAPPCDAQKLAFVSDRDGNEEIYLMNGDGSGQQRLTNSLAADTDPDWAPTGQAVVFQSMRNGNWDIYRVDLLGTNLLQLTDDAADDVDPVWSPDGEWIAFRSNRDGTWQIYVMPATGGAATRLSTGSGDNLQAVWSPTSTQLAYQSDRDGNWEIYVGDIATHTETRVTNDLAKSQAPTWSCTGDSVVYQTDADGNWELYHVETETGLLLARVTDDLATDIYPAWVPGEEDGSLLGLDIPLPTPVPTATPLPTATPTPTSTPVEVPTATPTAISEPTLTPVLTETPTPTSTPIEVPTVTATLIQPATKYWIYLPPILRGW